MRPGGVACGAACPDHFAVRNIGAIGKSAGLNSNSAKVSVPRIVTIRMPQTDVNSQVTAVILRVVPTRINDLVGVCRSQNGTITYPVINPIMPIIKNISAQLVTPVAAKTIIA